MFAPMTPVLFFDNEELEQWPLWLMWPRHGNQQICHLQLLLEIVENSTAKLRKAIVSHQTLNQHRQKKNSDKKRTSSNKSKKKDPDTASQTTKEGTQDLRNNKKSKKIHLEEASEATTIPKAGEFEVEEERKSKHSDRRLKPSQRAKDAADTA
mmetsp:Transcript_10569/g.13848  ORF Transcript_10569/g.13848 Transcript_10569/m.13848 type:complete len:153 (-) Transcript_10569:119-577(-)